MKVLVIGANGFLGLRILKYGKEKYTQHEFIGADLNIELIPNYFKKFTIDITNKEQVECLIQDLEPDVTILTAAMTNVDACEDLRDKAYSINALGPKYIAESIKKINKKLIHISTDFIFDGNTGMYNEDNIPNPISYYGETKLQGEKFIIDSGVNYLICRTSVLYGWTEDGQRDNFFMWAYKNLKNLKPIKIVSTQYNSPTLVDDLAHALLSLLDFKKSDIFHTCGSEPISRYNFVKKIAIVFGFDEKLIEEVKVFQQKAHRPPNSSLCIEKIQKKYNIKFKNITKSMEFLKEIDNKRINFKVE